MANILDFLTEEGKAHLKMASECGLGEYYDEMCGHIIIPFDEFTVNHMVKILEFVKAHNDWAMGFEWTDAVAQDEGYVYVSPREDLC